MSTSHAITDFLIELGFDASKVEKGLKEVGAEFEKFSKKVSKTSANKAKDGATAGLDKSVKKETNKALKTYKDHLERWNDSSLSQKRTMLNQAEVQARREEKLRNDAINKAATSQSNAAEAARIAQINNTAKLIEEKRKADKKKADEAKKIADRERARRAADENKAYAEDISRTQARNKRLARLEIERDRLRTNMTVQNDGFNNKLTNNGTTQVPKNIAQSKEYNNILKKQRKLLDDLNKAKSGGEIKRITNDLKLLRSEQMKVVGLNKQMNKEMNEASFTSKSLTQSMNNLARSYLSVYAVLRGGQEIIRKGMEIQSARVGLMMGTGSPKAAAEEYKFLTEMAYKYGASIDEMTLSYGKISAGAKAAGLSTLQVREVFAQLNDAAIGFSLTSAEMNGVFKAITDSFSKGTLMSEELKGQLGDRMPVAITAMSEALDVSTQELFKMMENGELLASDTIPKLTRRLQEMAQTSGALKAGMNTSSKEMDRVRTKFQLLVGEMFDSGMEEGLAEFFRITREILDQSSPLFQAIGKIFGGLTKVAGVILILTKQMVRPLEIAINNLSDSFSIADGELGFLTKGFIYLAWAMTYPFELLEKFNDWAEKKKGIWGLGAAAVGIALFAGKAYLLNKVLSMVFGVGRISRWLSGWGLVVSAAKAAWYPFAKLGSVIGWLFQGKVGGWFATLVTSMPKFISGTVRLIQGAFALIGKHPLIAALIALSGFVIAGFQDKTHDLAARYGEGKGVIGKTWGWAKAIAVSGAENTAYGATGGLYSPDWAATAGRSSTSNKSSTITNNINITGHSPEDVANKIMPLVKGEIVTTTNNMFSTNMSSQE